MTKLVGCEVVTAMTVKSTFLLGCDTMQSEVSTAYTV